MIQTRVDYEVEVGAVIGKPITWESIQEMDKQQLLSCIAGFVLVSDIKARNPRLWVEFLQLHQKNGNGRTSYRFRHVKLDECWGTGMRISATGGVMQRDLVITSQLVRFCLCGI